LVNERRRLPPLAAHPPCSPPMSEP
jgi:hypothetical protein